MRPIPKHGTVSRYNSPKHSCHCDKCTYASREYQRQRRANRPDVVQKNRDGVNKRQRANYKLIVSTKEGKPCTDCGVTYPHYVMHWDHLDGSTKLFTISQMRQKTQQKILDEIAKCELVCANCHAFRTHDRLKKTKNAIDLIETL